MKYSRLAVALLLPLILIITPIWALGDAVLAYVRCIKAVAIDTPSFWRYITTGTQ